MHNPGHSAAAGHRANCCLLAFFPWLLCFKNENVKLKVRYGFVLHTGLTNPLDPPST